MPAEAAPQPPVVVPMIDRQFYDWRGKPYTLTEAQRAYVRKDQPRWDAYWRRHNRCPKCAAFCTQGVIGLMCQASIPVKDTNEARCTHPAICGWIGTVNEMVPPPTNSPAG